MVEILPAKRSFGTGFTPAFQTNLQKSLDRFLGEQTKKEEATAKSEVEGLESLQQNKILEKFFGKEFAELHGALGTGERTKFFEQVLESHQRGESARKLLGKWEQQAGETSRSMGEEVGEEQIDATETISPEGITETFEEEEEIRRTPKEKVTRKEKQEERSFQRNKPYLERISEMANELPKEGLALQQMKGAMDTGDFNSYRNVVGEILGAEVLKTATAQVVNSASKQFLLSSLASMTGAGRPNTFLERSITKALISPLYKQEANQLIYEGLEGLYNLRKREIEIAQEEEHKYTADDGEVPRNFQQIVNKKLKKDAQAFEKEYEQRVKELLSSKDDQVMVISPDGIRGTLPKDQVGDAVKNKGYKRA